MTAIKLEELCQAVVDADSIEEWDAAEEALDAAMGEYVRDSAPIILAAIKQAKEQAYALGFRDGSGRLPPSQPLPRLHEPADGAGHVQQRDDAQRGEGEF